MQTEGEEKNNKTKCSGSFLLLDQIG